MSFNLIIQLPTAGAETGPFDIYAEPGHTLVANNVPKASLLAPAVYVVTVPDGTTGITVQSDNAICNNKVDVVLELPCYCNEINAKNGSATIDYIECDSVDNSITSIIVANKKEYLCAKMGTLSKRNVTGVVDIQPGSKLCSTNDDCFVEPPLCHQIEIIGTSKVSWVDGDNISYTYTYTDVTINVCANRNSITYVGGTVNITVGTTYCDQQSDCWPALNLQATLIDKFMIRQLYIWGSLHTPTPNVVPWMIDYGDGHTAYFTGTQTFSNGGPADHSYSGLFTGTIKIKAPSLQLIKTIIDAIAGQSFTTGTVILTGFELSKLIDLFVYQGIRWKANADASQIPRKIYSFYSLSGQIIGDIINLPPTIVGIWLQSVEANTLTGDIANFPSTLKRIYIMGNNTIYGNIANLPPTFATQLINFNIEGVNNVTGDLAAFSTYTVLEEIHMRGHNTIYGNLSNVPTTIKYLRLLGWSSPTGNTSGLSGHINMTTLELQNNTSDPLIPPGTGNTLTGDIANLPDSLITTIISGRTTVYGDIINMPTGQLVVPGSQTIWIVNGSNTVNGNIGNINPNCKYFLMSGWMNFVGDIGTIPASIQSFSITYLSGGSFDISGIYGDLKDLPPNIIKFTLEGNHHVNTYTGVGKVWAPNMSRIYVKPFDRVTYRMSTAQIDQLLIDLANTTWYRSLGENPGYVNEIYLVGTRSAASNAAVTYLTTIPAPNTVTVTVGP